MLIWCGQESYCAGVKTFQCSFSALYVIIEKIFASCVFPVFSMLFRVCASETPVKSTHSSDVANLQHEDSRRIFVLSKSIKMTTAEKKQAILNVIFERASELEDKAIEFLEITTKSENIDYFSLRKSALKKAFQEWNENKQVFNTPQFLKG